MLTRTSEHRRRCEGSGHFHYVCDLARCREATRSWRHMTKRCHEVTWFERARDIKTLHDVILSRLFIEARNVMWLDGVNWHQCGRWHHNVTCHCDVTWFHTVSHTVLRHYITWCQNLLWVFRDASLRYSNRIWLIKHLLLKCVSWIRSTFVFRQSKTTNFTLPTWSFFGKPNAVILFHNSRCLFNVRAWWW